MKSTSIMRRNSAASDFANGADSATPALAIRISIGWRLAASAIAALTAAWSATSATPAKCASPAATASSSVARLRPSTVTVAPARTSADAIARPMPRPPPVTRAWEERGSPDMRGPPRVHSSTSRAYILNLKRLQERRELLVPRLPALAQRRRGAFTEFGAVNMRHAAGMTEAEIEGDIDHPLARARLRQSRVQL